jgi:phospholipid/cholesterol/gamma-HCH transport system substrate-binding protein
MSRSLSRWQAILLGVLVLLALGLGTVGLFAVGSRGWFGKGSLAVRAGFREIRGVEVGTRVRIQGIDAGEVVAIDPPAGPDDPVILRLRVKSEFRHLVRVGSTVQIVSEGMIGGKVVELRAPVTAPGKPAPDLSLAPEGALLASEPSAELADVLGQVGDAIKGIQSGQGSLGKLLNDPQAYDSLVALLRSSNDVADRSKDTLTSIQRDADALKKLPLIGGYIEDPTALLVRPKSERNRRVYAEGELFEPGRAVLTAKGRENLDTIVSWLEGLKHKGSDVVIVTYADPKTSDTKTAATITRQQSEAVITYLKDNYKVHKLGWFSSRKVTPLGMGLQAPPSPEKDKLPAGRVEVIVFVPLS